MEQQHNNNKLSNLQSQSQQPMVSVAEMQSAMLMEKNRQWALFGHLSSLAGCLVPVVGNIVGPLVIWQIKKDELPFASRQAKEALNFQLSLLIYSLLCLPLIFIFIGVLLLFALGFFGLVMVIIAAIKSNGGEEFRYPITIRIVQ